MNTGWMRAIDDALVNAHLGVANHFDTYDSAKAKLDLLIDWHVSVATDPAVNGGYKLTKQADNEKPHWAPPPIF